MTASRNAADRRGAATLICWLVLGLEGLLALLITGHSSDRSSRPAAEQSSISGEASIADVAPESPDDRFRRAMLGDWEDDYQGHRVLTLNEDGTGVMIVAPAGLAAFTYAAKLTFQERWTVSDGQVRMDATGGQPAVAVRMILKLYGSSATFRIDDISAERMILIDLADRTRFEWRRLKADQ